ncbi:hypothetical protein MRX96_047859 [Rhipicephalus microplus]
MNCRKFVTLNHIAWLITALRFEKVRELEHETPIGLRRAIGEDSILAWGGLKQRSRVRTVASQVRDRRHCSPSHAIVNVIDRGLPSLSLFASRRRRSIADTQRCRKEEGQVSRTRRACLHPHSGHLKRRAERPRRTTAEHEELQARVLS